MVGLLGAAVTIAVVTGGIKACRHHGAMQQALADLQAANQADTVFRSDSAAQALVRYFDRPWHRRNDRVLAYYLLGRAHADMGEAPQAIEAYQTAIECADTTDEDCDFRILRNVYGQMADIFERQNLWDSELEAYQYYGIYSQKIGDIYEYARSYLFVSDVLFNKGDVTSALQFINIAKQIYLEEGMQKEASQVYASPIHFAILHRQFDKARPMMETYERESGLFDAYGNIQQGREIYYYDKGVYYLNCLQPDSAEYMFRKLLPIQVNAIDAYRGLLELFRYQGNVDSIAKYAASYEDALVEYLNTTQTDAVIQAKSMYDYTRHRRIAEQEKERATMNRLMLFIVIILFSIGSTFTYFHYLHKKQQREREYQFLMMQYLQIQQKFKSATNELQILKNLSDRSAEAETLLEEKEQQITFLEKELNRYTQEFQRLKSSDRETLLKNSDIVKKLKGMLEVHTIRQGSKVYLAEKETPSQTDWMLLAETVKQCLPLFYSRIMERGYLTDQEWKTAILLRIGFKANEVANLLETLPSRVSKLKILINGKLFNASDTESLMSNLSSI